MINSKSAPVAIIVDGISLENISKSIYFKDFVELIIKCNMVLCCRMSPSQKAQVKLFKSLFFGSRIEYKS
jgi:magnesium-transporting ATPase (P-type)